MCSRFKYSVLYAVSSVAALIGAFVLGTTGAQAASCSGLASLSMSLPNVTITTAQSVPAGTFTAAGFITAAAGTKAPELSVTVPTKVVDEAT